jgi:tRNA uridine 5-carboxymethylaminomethyl modification enzyme
MIEEELVRLRNGKIIPSEVGPEFLKKHGFMGLKNALSYEHFLRRPEVTYSDLAEIDPNSHAVPDVVKEQAEIQIKYQGYIDRQLQEVERAAKLEGTRIPDCLDYSAISGFSSEVREKLIRFRPDTLGQASRIPGVTPAAITVLSIAIKSLGIR